MPSAAAQASDHLDPMSNYLRSLARAEVMAPAQEARLAHQYRAACLEVWRQAVHMPETLLRILAGAEAIDPVALAQLKPRLGRPRSKRAYETAAQLMRDADEGRTWYDAMIGYARKSRDVGAGAPLPTMVHQDPRHRDYIQALCLAADRADALRNQFVKHNLRLVVSVARRYRNSSMSMIDLISEGNLGLVRAVERYQPERGYRFSTYATWWIRHAIGRAISDRGRSIRIPVHMLEAIHKLGGIERLYLRDHGALPDAAHLARELGVSVARADEILQWRAEHAVSLDAPIDDGGERTLGESLADTEADAAPQRALEHASLMRVVTAAMRSLPPVEAAILRARFGVDDGEEQTLQQLGERHRLSRERIRQIQAQSLRKLRKIIGNAV